MVSDLVIDQIMMCAAARVGTGSSGRKTAGRGKTRGERNESAHEKETKHTEF